MTYIRPILFYELPLCFCIFYYSIYNYLPMCVLRKVYFLKFTNKAYS